MSSNANTVLDLSYNETGTNVFAMVIMPSYFSSMNKVNFL